MMLICHRIESEDCETEASECSTGSAGEKKEKRRYQTIYIKHKAIYQT